MTSATAMQGTIESYMAGLARVERIGKTWQTNGIFYPGHMAEAVSRLVFVVRFYDGWCGAKVAVVECRVAGVDGYRVCWKIGAFGTDRAHLFGENMTVRRGRISCDDWRSRKILAGYCSSCVKFKARDGMSTCGICKKIPRNRRRPEVGN